MEELIHWKRPWSWEIEGRRRRRLRWVDGITNSNGHEFEQTPGDGKGQGGLACCSLWGCKESDTVIQRLSDWTTCCCLSQRYKTWMWRPSVHVCSVAQLCMSLLQPHVACQAPLSMRVPKQEYWSRLLPSSPRNLSSPGTEPTSPASPAWAHGFFTTEPPEIAHPLAFLHHSVSYVATTTPKDQRNSCGRLHFGLLPIPIIRKSQLPSTKEFKQATILAASIKCHSKGKVIFTSVF